MADNVTVGSYTYATDDIGGDHFQRCKLIVGADGVNDGDVASGNPLPVTAVVTTLPALVAGTANIGDVDVLSLPALPAGSNNIGDVDVLSLPALPAGSNAIGKLAANSGVDIGDVDITSIAAGDNNIGNVDVVTLPAIPAGTNNIGDVDVLTLPALAAGTNLIGSVAAPLSTSAVMNGVTAVAPAYASIDTATSGDVTIVDPGAGKKVRVLAFNIIAVGTAVNIYFKTGSTAKFGSATRPLVLDKTGATGPAGFNSGFNPLGWFEGAADENLVLNLSAAQGVIGNVVYVEL